MTKDNALPMPARTYGCANGIVFVGVLLLIGCDGSPSSVKENAEPIASEQKPVDDGTPASKVREKPEENTSSKPRSEEDPVAVVFKAPAGGLRAGETFAVSVVVDIASFHEIHDRDARPPFVPTRMELKLPNGFRARGEWTAPAPVRSIMPDGHPAYAGEVTFQREIQIEDVVMLGEYELECSIRYQACTERFCFPPKNVKLSVPISVVP
jgi:hypothetical protein